MRHPRRAAIALVLPLLVLAACGDDSPPPDDAAATLPPVTTAPTAPTSGSAGGAATTYDVATGPDDVVISVTNEGGFVPVGVAFANTPIAMITGDGQAITTGPVTAIYPGPLLPNVLQRSITPAAVQQLLAEAEELGLLADVTYEGNDMIADAGTTVVTITVDGTTYRHEAYALGFEDETDPARAALAEFVAAVSDLPTTVGAAELGPEEAYVADDYLIQALPVDPAALGGDDGMEPVFVPWPADAPVRLADAETCAVVPAAGVAPLFVDATTLTFFTDPGATDGSAPATTDGTEVIYAVTPVPQLPGRDC